MATLKRKFGGKYYKFYDSYRRKEEAEQEAADLRAKGNFVRITIPKDRLSPYYELWVRRVGR